MKKLALFAFALTLATTKTGFAKDIVVLVPGFFNSFAPEYFSNEIIDSFKNKNLTVRVADGLNPVGTIEENGAKLDEILAQIEAEEKKSGEATTTFHLVAHSAGGFYGLYVANLQKYKIKNILTVSTPYEGAEFVQVWLKSSILFNLATEFIRLEGLKQLTGPGVKKFLNTVRVSPETKIIAFGGIQNKSLDVWNAKFLSVPLRVTGRYISEKSDGIVGFSSAMAKPEILTTDGTLATHINHPEHVLPLEHWEQVLDSKSFVIFGIRNTSYIKDEQTRFYSGLADYLMTLL